MKILDFSFRLLKRSCPLCVLINFKYPFENNFKNSSTVLKMVFIEGMSSTTKFENLKYKKWFFFLLNFYKGIMYLYITKSSQNILPIIFNCCLEYSIKYNEKYLKFILKNNLFSKQILNRNSFFSKSLLNDIDIYIYIYIYWVRNCLKLF